MATTQYKDNAEHIYEFQQEAGDAGGAEKRPVAGMPAQVRTQLADMASSLLALAGTIISGSVKVVLQASNVVIGKLAPNPGVNIGTVDVAAGTNHIGSVAVDAALPTGANAIGKLASNVGVNIGIVDVANVLQLPVALGQRNMATSLGVALASDQSPLTIRDGGSPLMVIGNGGNPLPVSGIVTVGNNVAVTLGTSLPAGNFNIGDVDVATMPPLPQLPAALGQTTKAGSLPVVLASDTGTLTVSVAGNVALGASGNTIGKLGVNAGVNIGTVDVLASGTAAVATVVTSFTAVTLAAANAARVGLIVANTADASSELYLKFGTAASSTSWTAIVQPGGYWEMPRRYYTGIVTGIWMDYSRALPVGSAHVTET